MADSGRSRREPNPRLIPVAELLAAQKRIRHLDPAVARPVPAAPETSSPQPDASGPRLPARQQPGSQVHDDEPVRERQRGRPAGAAGHPAATRRRRRSLVLGAAVAVVLCGGLGVAGVLAGRDAPVPAPPVAGPEHITGAKVFRPDVIKASLRAGEAGDAGGQRGQNGGGTSAGGGTGAEATGGEDTTNGGERGTTGNGTQAPGRSGQDGAGAESQGQQGAAGGTGAPGQQPASSEQPAPATTTSGTEPLAPGSDPVLNTILQFYATAPAQPAIAFGLLHPSVQEGTLADFAASWQGISSAQVLSATPAGTHVMTVRVLLLRTDGTRLLTTQRIEVRGGARPRIVDAQLLSASAG